MPFFLKIETMWFYEVPKLISNTNDHNMYTLSHQIKRKLDRTQIRHKEDRTYPDEQAHQR